MEKRGEREKQLEALNYFSFYPKHPSLHTYNLPKSTTVGGLFKKMTAHSTMPVLRACEFLLFPL